MPLGSQPLKVLVTGNAGFIGFHVTRYLLERGDTVIGVDNLSDYYDTSLKQTRLSVLSELAKPSGSDYHFELGDLADQAFVETVFEQHEFDRVIHMAAQPGVRYSIDHPRAYIHSNIDAFINILEACRYQAVPHLTYASSSSVYGANTHLPYSEEQAVAHPLALYAATKKSNELMAHSYSHLFGLPTTGLRFFTVYGPWGRPDMAFFLFTRKILAGEEIEVFNAGKHTRDFTYIDDIVEGVVRASDDVAQPDPEWDARKPNLATSSAPYRIFNIGNHKPVQLLDYIAAIESELGVSAKKRFLQKQDGDVDDTCADVSRLKAQVGYAPSTTVEEGVARFIAWYREYYRV